jgi:uncharacterized protein (DUF433 family)
MPANGVVHLSPFEFTDRAGGVGHGQHGHVSYERITTDPDVMAGVPCIRGLRFPVATVVAMVADGMTTDEILAEHPDLTAEDILPKA